MASGTRDILPPRQLYRAFICENNYLIYRIYYMSYMEHMYRVSIEFWYKSTRVVSRMLPSDWLRYSLSLLRPRRLSRDRNLEHLI